MKTSALKKILLVNTSLILIAAYYCVFIDNYVEPSWLILAIGLTNLVLFTTFYSIQRYQTYQNPFEHIKIEQNLFYLDNHVFPIADINVIIVNQVDGRGLLQLPYIADGKVCYQFDPAYIRKLQQFIAKKLPQAELVI